MTRGGWLSVVVALALAASVGGILLAELRTGPLVAAGVALAAYFLVHNGLERALPRRRDMLESSPGVEASAEDAIVALLADAELAATRLDAMGKAARGKTSLTLRELARLSRSVAALVMQDPNRLDSVMRLFTYYLPAAADLAEDRARLTGSAGQGRLSEIDHTLDRLAVAFASFERAALEPDLRDVDIDLRLIDQALSSDGAMESDAGETGSQSRKFRG